MDVILRNLPFLLKGTFPEGSLGGLALTLYMSVSIGFASFCVGLLFATATLMPYRLLRWLARGLSMGIRGVPALAFLFWMYFLVPRLLQVNLSPLQSAGLALMLYHGAYMGEDIRGGIQAVAKGQWEAARASGLKFLDLMQHVVLPGHTSGCARADQPVREPAHVHIGRIGPWYPRVHASGHSRQQPRNRLFVASVRVRGPRVFWFLLPSLALWTVPGKPLELGPEDRHAACCGLTTMMG